MSKQEKKKRIQWKAVLIAFGITCVMLGIVIGLTVWFETKVMTLVEWQWNTPEVWIGNAVAFLIMFAIIYHFVKKPKEDRYSQEKW